MPLYSVPLSCEVNEVGQLEKLLERIRNNPKIVRFEELDMILRRSGFERRQPGSGSSHYMYTKGDKRLSIPYRRPYVLEAYVKRATELLEGENPHGDQ